MEETSPPDRRTFVKTDSTKQLTAAERAERILKMCSIVEESRERIKHAEKVADGSSRKDRELFSPQKNLKDDDEETGSSGSEYANTENYAGNNSNDDEIVSVAYTHRSVTDLTTGQLKEKLRQCQLSLLKANENAKLKYLRLQTEYSKLKESVITIQSEAQHFKIQTQRFMKERDEARRNVDLAKKTRDKVMKKITDENESLRNRVEALKQVNHTLLQQREVFRCKLDGCTCQDIELEDFSPEGKKERSTKSANQKNSGNNFWSRHRDFQSERTLPNHRRYNIDMERVTKLPASDRNIRQNDDGTQTTLANVSPFNSDRSLSRDGTSISSESSRGLGLGMFSSMWRSTRNNLSEEASVKSKSSRSQLFNK